MFHHVALGGGHAPCSKAAFVPLAVQAQSDTIILSALDDALHWVARDEWCQEELIGMKRQALKKDRADREEDTGSFLACC